MDLIHHTKNIKRVMKQGLKPYNGVFGKAIYLVRSKDDIHSYGNTVSLKVKLDKVKLNTEYNNNEAYNNLMELKKRVGDLQKYFLLQGFDGLDLTKFLHEPQIVLFNKDKISDYKKLSMAESVLRLL